MRTGVVVVAAVLMSSAACKKDGAEAATARRDAVGNRVSGIAGAERPRDSTVNTAASSQVRLPTPDARLRTVLFIGTSLTAGLGLDPDSAYPRLLQRRADSLGMRYRFVNAGLSGETSAGALRRVDWLLRGDADVVLIETGANDGLRGLDVDSTAKNIREVVRKVRSARPNAAILLIQMEAPPNLGPRYTKRFHDMYGEISRAERVRLVPFLLERVAGVARLNQGDGIHPNDVGEKIVADNVWKSLSPVLDSLDRSARGG